MSEIVLVKSIKSGDGDLNYPSGICYYEKNNLFYIADMQNHRICWLKEDGSIGELPNSIACIDICSTLMRPLALWITNHGTLFVADAEHNNIFYKTQQEEVWRPIKIDSEFTFNFPAGVTVDEIGNIYTNDFLNNRLVKITSDGDVSVLIEGSENINKPYGIFYHNNKLYYTDTGNARICYLDIKDNQVHILNPQAETKELSYPIAITLDMKGNIYVCEQRRMYLIDINTNVLSLILNQDIWKEQMQRHYIKDRICHIGAAFVKNKGEIYWVDTIKGCIYKTIIK